jgi:GTPase-associated protein 1, N-terminal domain type 2
MPSQDRASRSGPPPRSQPVHQVYLTHCLLVDSVFNIAEFTVRAASPMDHDLLRLVDRYPTFELPIVLWSKDPAPEHTPRRLALVNLTDDLQALIHSAYLSRDTVGRVGNQFTHVLIAPRFDPLEAIRSWAARAWCLAYEAGEDKVLPDPKGVPQGNVLNDEQLQRFLSSAPIDVDDVALATQTIPERLLQDAPGRRELMARFLQAVILITQQENNRRGPLYIHAEPGLLALLLFGAYRLLPRGWTYDLTFSTYENPDTTLRSYDRALVVGTYLDDPRRQLEADYLERYGYGIDTFHTDRVSDELLSPVPEAVDALLNLAAAGDWDVVDRLHEKCGNARIKLASIRETVRRLRAVTRLGRDAAALEDLVLLAGDDDWRKLFDEHEATNWPRIREACLADPSLALRFARTLRKEYHLKELRRGAGNRLANEDFAGWERDWALIQSIMPKREKEQFALVVDEARLGEHPSPAVKAVLRREWLKCEGCDRPGKPPETPPWPRLLRAENDAELSRLQNDADLPAHWKAGVLCHAILAGTMTDSVRGHLLRADSALFERSLYIGRNKFHENPNYLIKLIASDPPAFDLMDRFLATGVKYLSVSTWAALVRRLNSLDRETWEHWWLQNERLTLLLVSLEDAPAARDVWEPIVLELTARSSLADQRLIKLFVQIIWAYEKLCHKLLDTPAHVLMPEEIDALERTRVHLALHFPETVFHFPDCRPLLDTVLTPQALKLSCRHWPDGDKTRVEPLRKRFKGELGKTDVIYAQLRPNDESDRKRLDVFFRDVFQRFYPLTDEETWAPALIAWCRMIRDCSPEKQLVLQKYFLRELNPTVEQRYQLRVHSGNVLLQSLSQQIDMEHAELQQRRESTLNFSGDGNPEDAEESGDFQFPNTSRAAGRRGKRGGRSS